MPDHLANDIDPVPRVMAEDTELQAMPSEQQHHDALKTGATAHNSVGFAVSQQQDLIPTTGDRKVTTRWEYWTYCVFFFSPNAAPVAVNGGSLLQLLMTLQYPDDNVPWGGRILGVDSIVLDINGIVFAVQLVILLSVGPFADYGNWRPYILIVCEIVLVATSFAMIGVKNPSQWVTVEALYIIGTVANNVALAFYMAAFPGIVQDLPRVRESERAMLMGEKAPEEHEKLDSYERAKLNNVLNFTGSGVQVIAFAAACGIAAGAGYATNAQIIHSYQILLGFFGACCILTTVPYFIVERRRPGQQLPPGANWFTVGFIQMYTAAKNIKRLKQCIIYMFAYFMLQETYGTYFTIVGILQNQAISYSPVELNALTVVGNLAGGSGNLFIFLLQRKFRFSNKAGVIYGAIMTLVPNLWGAIGTFTNTIGFHHGWEFWLSNAWNFQMAAWSSYQVAFLSEIIPAPKAYLFFALFNTVGKTSSFIGPFISSAITERTNGNANAAFWFTFAMGSIGAVILCFVDPAKAKLDNVKLLEEEARELYGLNADNNDELPASQVVREQVDQDKGYEQ